jgi:2-methylisocitrate lyase-like PEP mutase family enzyme
MQTRAELYDVLGYQAWEDKLDSLFAGTGLKTGK